jgi:hypothetical protein
MDLFNILGTTVCSAGSQGELQGAIFTAGLWTTLYEGSPTHREVSEGWRGPSPYDAALGPDSSLL